MLTQSPEVSQAPGAAAAASTPSKRFFPAAPGDIQGTGLTEAFAETLVFKTLMSMGTATSREIVRSTALPVKPVVEALERAKKQQLVFHRGAAAMGDFDFSLTDSGRLRASQYMQECAYVGRAPVTLEDYVKSVGAQGITTVHPKKEDLERAFGDLLINRDMFARLGPAINSGRGLFLYGFPGNGKSSIAERITDCFGDNIWLPYAIFCAGELITIYDPQLHQVADSAEASPGAGTNPDPRWVLVRRPTIVVGGELTMDSLDLCFNAQTRITESSLQMKSNTGTLVIDDFGRQRMRPLELLNRWIVPLEKRYDFLALANGKKIKAPFDQLIIFSTNLEPKDLVDEAFLRRIPYKINVVDPTEEEFRQLFGLVAPHLNVEITPGAIDHLIERHYRAVGRPFRCCQPRDLLMQVRNHASYNAIPAVATPDSFDLACENYFATL